MSERPCANLTDVTLADEDTNSILTDIANRAIQGNVAMQVMRPGDQIWKQCKFKSIQTDNVNRAIQGNVVMQPGDQYKLCHLLAKFATNASGAI